MDGLTAFRNLALAAGLAAGIGATLGAPSTTRATPRTPAVAGDTGADGAQVTPKMIEAGRSVFHGAGACFACHGMNMQGSAIAPPLDKKGKPWLAAKGGTYDAILHVVEAGVPGTAMVARPNGISDEAAKNVAAYIWAISQGKAKP
jgi:mono/diheme cytochrome c family protein